MYFVLYCICIVLYCIIMYLFIKKIIFVLIAKIQNTWLYYHFINYDTDITIYFPVLN